jgi:hypothetical protein
MLSFIDPSISVSIGSMNDNMNMYTEIEGSMNDNINMDTELEGSMNDNISMDN